MNFTALDMIDAKIRYLIASIARPELHASIERNCQSISTLYAARAIANEYIIRSRSTLEGL